MNFTSEGRDYSARKLDAFGQFAIARKILPLLPAAAPVVAALLEERDAPFTPADAANLLAKSEPIAMALARMPDDDFNSMMRSCLSVVEFKGTDRQFHPLMSDGVLMLPLSIFELIPIVARVVTENLFPTSAAVEKLRTAARIFQE